MTEVSYFQATTIQATLQIKLTPTGEREITSGEIVEVLNTGFEDFGETTVTVNPGGVGPPTEDFQFFVQVFSDDQNALEEITEEIKTFLDNREVQGGEKVTDVEIANITTINKKNSERFAEVKAKLSDPNNSGLIIELEKQVKEEFNDENLASFGLELDNLGFDQGMESENVQSFNSALFALMISLIIMYGVLTVQFDSFAQPLLILFAIPFTFVGFFPGLYFTDNALSFFVMIGVIALSGIVVNNTILLTDFANQERERGLGIREAITKAVKVRYRPLVTTSVTTIAGLLPLALADAFWESLAFTIIFGLLASTTLVILAFPAFYAGMEKVRHIKLKPRSR